MLRRAVRARGAEREEAVEELHHHELKRKRATRGRREKDSVSCNGGKTARKTRNLRNEEARKFTKF